MARKARKDAKVSSEHVHKWHNNLVGYLQSHSERGNKVKESFLESQSILANMHISQHQRSMELAAAFGQITRLLA